MAKRKTRKDQLIKEALAIVKRELSGEIDYMGWDIGGPRKGPPNQAEWALMIAGMVKAASACCFIAGGDTGIEIQRAHWQNLMLLLRQAGNLPQHVGSQDYEATAGIYWPKIAEWYQGKR